MAHKIFARSKNNKVMLIKENNTLKNHIAKHIYQKYSVTAEIRLWPNEFNQIKNHTYLTHFNLQFTRHKKGKRYILVKILKPGYFDGTKEMLPVITLKDAQIFECISTRNHISYEDLRIKDFKHSFENIKNIKQLQKEILKRYRNFRVNNMTGKDKLALGVGITELKRIRAIRDP